MPSLAQLIRVNAQRDPNTACIVSPAGDVLTWQQLVIQLERTHATLGAFGFGANDRIAIVLPNGPALAVAFLTVGACAACAPLNPVYGVDEFAFYLSDLRAQALIVSEVASEIRQVCGRSAWNSRAGTRTRSFRDRAVHFGVQFAHQQTLGGLRYLGQCRPIPPHVRDDIQTETRTAPPPQSHCFCRQYDRCAEAVVCGPVPQSNATIPHSRPGRGTFGAAGGGRICCVPT